MAITPYQNVQNPTAASSAPLAGIYNIDQMPALTFQNGQVIGLGSALAVSYVADTSTTSFTVPATEILSGQDNTLNLTGTLGAGATITLPTAALIGAFLAGNESVGQGFNLRIINSSSANFAWTVAAGTGGTASGTLTIAQNTWRDFYLVISAVSNGVATAYTLQSIGTGTQS